MLEKALASQIWSVLIKKCMKFNSIGVYRSSLFITQNSWRIYVLGQSVWHLSDVLLQKKNKPKGFRR